MLANGMLYEKNLNKQPRIHREKESLIKSLRNLSLLKENNLSQSLIIQSQKKQSKINNSQELKEKFVLKETEKIKHHNLKQILKNELSSNNFSYQQSFLSKHKIEKEMRTKMVDWMIEVLSSFSCEPNTFFIAIDLLDNFLSLTKKQYQSKDIHLIGVTCMLISSKMEEILPFKISTVVEKMTHNKITAVQIQQMEFEILTTLDFNLLRGKSLFVIVEFLFVKLNFFRMEKFQQIRRIFIYLSKMIIHDYDLIKKYSVKYLSASVLYITVKIIEQVKLSIDIDQIVEKLKNLLLLNEDIFFNSSEEVLGLAKTFEKKFPNSKNLQKFDSFQIEKLK